MVSGPFVSLTGVDFSNIRSKKKKNTCDFLRVFVKFRHSMDHNHIKLLQVQEHWIQGGIIAYL